METGYYWGVKWIQILDSDTQEWITIIELYNGDPWKSAPPRFEPPRDLSQERSLDQAKRLIDGYLAIERS